MAATTDISARIAFDGVPETALSAIAANTAIAANGSDATVLLMGDMTSARLSEAIARPFRGFVEYRPGDETLPTRIATANGSGDLCLTLTTATAFSMVDTARILCDALVQRNILAEEQRASVELALHETIANAILHGNLGIQSDLSSDSSLYEAFCAQLKDLLDSPKAHSRWIAITASWTGLDSLDVVVDDEGIGYEPSQATDRGDEAPSGRGLAIVNALASEVRVSNGGRRTLLRFANER